MKLSAHHYQQVREARKHLLDRGLHAAQIPERVVPQEIEESWRRSASLRVSPSREPRLLGDIDPEAALLRLTSPVLDQWQSNLIDSRLTVVLADQRGRIIARRSTSSQESRQLDGVHAAEGFDFSEESLGTNGLGTPIESRGVVYVDGPAHFNDALAEITCAGAPLRHPITGRVIGSISLATSSQHANILMTSMTRQIAHQISEELVAHADSRALELARIYRNNRAAGRSVIVMNSESVMTDQQTFPRLNAEAHALAWDTLQRHRWPDGPLRLTLPLLGTVAAERLGRDVHNPVYVLEFLKPSRTPELTQELCANFLRPRESAIPLPTHMAHRAAPATETHQPLQLNDSGRGPFADIEQSLEAAAQTPGVVLIVGESGTGRCHQAARWLRSRTGDEPEERSAQDIASALGSAATTQTAPLRHIADSLNTGRGVVIREAEALTDEARALLRDIALSLPATARPRIVLTGRDSAEGTDSGDAKTVHLRPLRKMRRQIPAVIKEVSSSLFPSATPPQISSAALQKLLSWSWAGNVTELRDVLRFASRRSNQLLIDIQHLPVDLQKHDVTRLSRYEQHEREAILGALRDADDNKSRAAELLGIGRTTLYRKMRTLKISVQ